MPQIIPIRDLKNTAEISERCKRTNEPIFITKNGYGDMVVMSIEHYTRTMAETDLYRKLKVADEQLNNSAPTVDAFEFMAGLKGKYEKLSR